MKTDWKSLITNGRSLARRLTDLSGEFHVKSAQHESLLWEAAVVTAKVAHLESGVPLPSDLRASGFDTGWGLPLPSWVGDLVNDVAEFHKNYHDTTS